jgi:sulfite oxidase
MAQTDMWGKHPAQLVRDPQWFNAGPPPELLRRSFVTPNDLFFTRNHGAVPLINGDGYRLEIGGMVDRPLQLDLETLRTAMPRRSAAVTLACAGLRRDELQAYRPIPGEVGWGAEPVSNGVWTGVPLRDVLLAAGVRSTAAHVEFAGQDEVTRHGETFGFGGSIPLEKAMSNEVLLAFDLNGEPLPAAHGFPLRAVVPGCIGARSVKWLSSITVTDHTSENYFQAHAYKTFPPDVTAQTVRWADGVMLHDLPLNAVIWSPLPNEVVHQGTVEIQGWAMAGAGRMVERVEISTDGGTTWLDADLSGEGSRWTWRFWSVQVRLEAGSHTIIARATDSEGNRQPERVDELWNFKGYMNNAWHRVTVSVA